MRAESLRHGRPSAGRALLIASVLLLTLVSWMGVLDTVSEDYVDGSLTKAVVAFGTARAIDAAIAVAQSTTVSVGIGAEAQVSPGQVLDPIHDLVENYSSAMKLAIASLVIQKVLLTVVSATVFKVLLMLSGLALIAGLLAKAVGPVNFLFRLFVSLVFLRFVLVAVVLLNGLVNHAFIDKPKDEALAQLSILPGDLEHQVGTAATLAKRTPVEELTALEGDLQTARRDLESSSRQLEAARAARSFIDRLNPFAKDAAQDKAAEAVRSGEARIAELLISRCDAARRAAVANADAICAEVPLTSRARAVARSAGQAVSGAVQAAATAIDLSTLRQRVERALIDMVNVMALFILQTLILPLVFFFAFSKAAKGIWGLDLGEMSTGGRQHP